MKKCTHKSKIFSKAPFAHVAITGMGIISALGQGVSVFTEALYQGKCGIKQFQPDTPVATPSITVAARLTDFDFASALQKFTVLPQEFMQKIHKMARRAPISIHAAIIAGLEAWQQAQLMEHDLDASRIGLIIAGNNIAQNYHYDAQAIYNAEPLYLSPSYALHFMDTDHVGMLSEILGIHGEGFTVGGASASSNIAIMQACRMIQSDAADVCVVVGALADLSPVELQGFYNIGALGGHSFAAQPEKACRPFDQQHEGFIYGQASGCLILESQASALERKVEIIGEIRGGAVLLDGNHLADPNQKNETKVMHQALAAANMQIADIDYINAHGTSSPLGDEVELAAIREVCGDAITNVWINSTKSITGHCLWSAGIVEIIATFIQMHENFLHPNLNLENPIDAACHLVGQQATPAVINTALSNAFGFGGINTSIVLTKGKNYGHRYRSN